MYVARQRVTLGRSFKQYITCQRVALRRSFTHQRMKLDPLIGICHTPARDIGTLLHSPAREKRALLHAPGRDIGVCHTPARNIGVRQSHALACEIPYLHALVVCIASDMCTLKTYFLMNSCMKTYQENV